MKSQIKFIALGFVLALMLMLAVVLSFFFIGGPHIRTIFHDQVLPSGKTVKVTMCNFAWGVEHDERNVLNDCFLLEYVSTVSHANPADVDRETVEVFEPIRPVSELWNLKTANVSAFPKAERKGRYFTYVFTQTPQGSWTYKRKPAKVFVND